MKGERCLIKKFFYNRMTLEEIRDSQDFYQMRRECLEADKIVLDQYHNFFKRYRDIDKTTGVRRVYKDDIRLFLPSDRVFRKLRKKMEKWKNIKAPNRFERLPFYQHIKRVMKLLIMLNLNQKDIGKARFIYSYRNFKRATYEQIILKALKIYIYNILNREDLLMVYKNLIYALFMRELSHMRAIGFDAYVEETKQQHPESFYTDGKAHFKCFDFTLKHREKAAVSIKGRTKAKKKIAKKVIWKAINPSNIKKYFNPTGGHKPLLLQEINERLVKAGFSPISDKTLYRWKAEIFKQNGGVNIRKIFKADKGLINEYKEVRKTHQRYKNRRLTIREIVEMVDFAIDRTYPEIYEFYMFDGFIYSEPPEDWMFSAKVPIAS